MSHPAAPMSQSLSAWMNEWMNETNEWLNEWLNDWLYPSPYISSTMIAKIWVSWLLYQPFDCSVFVFLPFPLLYQPFDGSTNRSMTPPTFQFFYEPFYCSTNLSLPTFVWLYQPCRVAEDGYTIVEFGDERQMAGFALVGVVSHT